MSDQGDPKESIEDYCIRASRVHPWALEAGSLIKGLKQQLAAQSQLLPRWIPVSERLPEYSEDRAFATYYARTDSGQVIALDWTGHKYAATERGRKPRWEWHGRLANWNVTHWLEFQTPPLPSRDAI